MDREKLLFFFLYFSLILITFLFIDTTPFGFLAPKYVAGSFMVGVSLFLLPSHKIRVPSPLIFLFPFLLLPSFIKSLYWRVSMQGYVWWLTLFFTYLLFSQIERERIFHLLRIMVLLVSFFSIWDYFSLPPFRWEKLGEKVPQIWVSIGNSNLTAQFIVLLSPFLFTPGKWKRSLLLWILPLVALILTHSKGAGMGILGALTILYLFRGKGRRRWFLLSVLPFLLISLFLSFKDTLTFQGRWWVWKVCGRMIKERPFLGWGWRTFPLLFPLFSPPDFHYKFPSLTPLRVHNDYLQFLCEGGLWGFIGFLIFLGIIIRGVFQGEKEEEFPFWWGAGLLALLIQALVSFPFQTPLSSFLFFSVGGLLTTSLKKEISFPPVLIPLFFLLWLFFILFPFLAHLEFRKGNYFLKEGNYSRSLVYYQRGVKLDPSHALLHNNLGHLLYKMGEREEAKEEFDKALRVNSSLVEAYLNRAWYYWEKGEKKKAREDLRKAMEIAGRTKEIEEFIQRIEGETPP